ncbi:site-specific integrase [Salipiger pacificus]|nr:site-specific integrase [Alloyangia pacifica]
MKKTRVPAHLERRPSSFYWRRRLPKLFANNRPNPFLAFSLQTHVVREAEVLARRLTWLSTLAFDYAKGAACMDTGTMELVLTELVRFEIAASDHARAIAPERSLVDAQMAHRRELALQDVLKEALFTRNREIAREPVREAARRLGVQVTEDSDDWKALAYEATRVLYDLSGERARRDSGEFPQPSPFFQAALTPSPSPTLAWGTPRVPSSAPMAQVSMAPVTSLAPQATPIHTLPIAAQAAVVGHKEAQQPVPTLSEAFRLYGEVRVAGKQGKDVDERADPKSGLSYKRNSFPNLQSTAKLVVDVIGDKPLSELTRADFVDAFSIIQKVPANHGKSATETRSIRDIVAATDTKEETEKARIRTKMKKAGASEGNIEAAEHQEAIPRLRVNTVYRHMQDTQRVLWFMIAHGHLTENLMKKVIWSKKEKKNLEILEEDNGRKIWGDTLPKLFRTPPFQGKLDEVGSPLFWAPLISLFHSLREEEALQLRPEDVTTEDGIDYFDIKVGAPWQRLKSKAATRRVPIHSDLIKLGFLDLVALRRRQGEDRLFPHLTRGRTRGTLSENFTKDFTRFRKAHGIYDKRIDFHSFRTQFNVELIRAKVDGELRHVLMGHEMDCVNLEFYGGEGHTLCHLQETVQKINIDISMIQSPFASAKETKVSDIHAARSRLRTSV